MVAARVYVNDARNAGHRRRAIDGGSIADPSASPPDPHRTAGEEGRGVIVTARDDDSTGETSNGYGCQSLVVRPVTYLTVVVFPPSVRRPAPHNREGMRHSGPNDDDIEDGRYLYGSGP